MSDIRNKVSSRSDRIPLSGSERVPLKDALQVGGTDPNERIEVTVVVRPRHSARSAARADFTTNEKLPGQRNYLSREELHESTGADPADIEKVASFVANYGIDVIGTSIAERYLKLSGTIGSFSDAFGVKLDRYSFHGKVYRLRSGPIHVPSELKSIIVSILGLDNRPQARFHSRYFTEKAGNIIARAISSSYTSPDLAKIYSFPNNNLDGSNQCIAIVELGGGHRSSELSQYFSSIGVPNPKVISVGVDGGHNNPGVDVGADGEVMLDIEVAGGVAPGARIVVYYAPNTDQGFLDAITKAIHDTINKPSVISISWGGPESNWTPQAMDAFNQAFSDAAAVGITVCCAAGDDGSSDERPLPENNFEIDDELAHVDFPASSPYVLACGGTKLEASDGTISKETVWNESNNGEGATGGGVSEVFPRPSYQEGLNIPPSVNGNGFDGRGLPDVSGDADPVTGYKILVDGRNGVIGGTSAVAPLWAGLIALLNQKLGKPVGFINPLLYKRFGSDGILRDITVGDNKVVNVKVKDNGVVTIKGYKAKQGWDPCTGWGSPDGEKLLNALQGEVTPSVKLHDKGEDYDAKIEMILTQQIELIRRLIGLGKHNETIRNQINKILDEYIIASKAS
jgi:kumamolisin